MQVKARGSAVGAVLGVVCLGMIGLVAACGGPGSSTTPTSARDRSPVEVVHHAVAETMSTSWRAIRSAPHASTEELQHQPEDRFVLGPEHPTDVDPIVHIWIGETGWYGVWGGGGHGVPLPGGPWLRSFSEESPWAAFFGALGASNDVEAGPRPDSYVVRMATADCEWVAAVVSATEGSACRVDVDVDRASGRLTRVEVVSGVPGDDDPLLGGFVLDLGAPDDDVRIEPPRLVTVPAQVRPTGDRPECWIGVELAADAPVTVERSVTGVVHGHSPLTGGDAREVDADLDHDVRGVGGVVDTAVHRPPGCDIVSIEIRFRRG